MKLRMLRSVAASPDGLRTIKYKAGKEFSVGDDLSQPVYDLFIRQGLAEAVEETLVPKTSKKSR